jgi:TonB family protein
VEAIRQWVYAPGRLNGAAVEVTTQVDVGFTLPDSLPLALTVERSAGQLILKWNRDADVLRDAERATLTVTDGDHTEDVPVDERMLRGGSVVYAPMTGNVQFRLEVVSREGKIVSESLTNTRVGEGSVPGGTRSAAPPTSARIRVSGNVQAANILYKVDPVYPPLARRARVQGTVRFTAIIGADGHVQNLQLISGHPLLVQAAREAVGQWVYRPVLLNGEPIERPTQIDVPFTLPEIR